MSVVDKIYCSLELNFIIFPRNKLPFGRQKVEARKGSRFTNDNQSELFVSLVKNKKKKKLGKDQDLQMTTSLNMFCQMPNAK